jgi:hypothetical protein
MLIIYKKFGITGWKSYWFFKNIAFRKEKKMMYKTIQIIATTNGMILSVPTVEKNQFSQIMKKIFEANLKDRRF